LLIYFSALDFTSCHLRMRSPSPHKQDKKIRHKLYNLGCRLRYLHDIHTLTYTDINYI
jgi:hypothetical protein